MKNILKTAGITILTLSASNNAAAQTKEETITILQTADIHAYLNPHNELFL